MSVSKYGVIELNAKNEVVWEYKLDEPERIYGLDYNPKTSNILVGYGDRVSKVRKVDKGKCFDFVINSRASLHSAFFFDTDENIIATATKYDGIYVTIPDKSPDFINLQDYFEKPDDLHEWGCEDWTHINFAKAYDDYIYATLYRHPTDRGKDGAILLINKDDYSLHRIISHYSLNRPHFAIPHPTIEQFMLVANTGSESVTAISKKTGATYWEYKINNGRNHIIPEEGRSPIACNFGAHYLETFNIAPTTDHALLMVIPNLRIARVIDLITGSTLHEYKVPEYIYKDAGIGEDPRPFQAKILY